MATVEEDFDLALFVLFCIELRVMLGPTLVLTDDLDALEHLVTVNANCDSASGHLPWGKVGGSKSELAIRIRLANLIEGQLISELDLALAG